METPQYTRFSLGARCYELLSPSAFLSGSRIAETGAWKMGSHYFCFIPATLWRKVNRCYSHFVREDIDKDIRFMALELWITDKALFARGGRTIPHPCRVPSNLSAKIPPKRPHQRFGARPLLFEVLLVHQLNQQTG